ncbi:MAG: FMN-binding negative transcriptional regulator [Sinobacteraceae bacterium]|nr:FMN-binding negative transcriptional regulator [Nevskiaceae bacterium]
MDSEHLVYLPDVFKETDAERIAQFVAQHPLATLIAVQEGRPHADHLPFLCLDQVAVGGTFIAHTSLANPSWKLAESRPEVLLIFSGATAYVSPSLYPSKQQTHEVVPTYNYVSVHVRGILSHSHDAALKLQYVERLTRAFEAQRAEPWAVSDAPAPYIDKMLKGLVALTLEVTSVTAKSKASQNRLPQDQLGVARGLAEQTATQEAAALVASRLASLHPKEPDHERSAQ